MTSTETALLSEIQTALGSGITPSFTLSSAPADIFEAYIFALLIEEAMNVGAIVSFEDNSGISPTTFTFRTSPGCITSRDPYTYAVISFTGLGRPPFKDTLEAHVGVYVTGKSTVKHECDVALIYRTEAETCRRNYRPSRPVIPRSSKVLLAVECKYYLCDLKINLARSFIGLVSDLGVKEACFVTNTTSRSVGKLLTRHAESMRRSHWEPNIIPSSLNDINRLRGLFKEVLKNYLER